MNPLPAGLLKGPSQPRIPVCENGLSPEVLRACPDPPPVPCRSSLRVCPAWAYAASACSLQKKTAALLQAGRQSHRWDLVTNLEFAAGSLRLGPRKETVSLWLGQPSRSILPHSRLGHQRRFGIDFSDGNCSRRSRPNLHVFRVDIGKIVEIQRASEVSRDLGLGCAAILFTDER